MPTNCYRRERIRAVAFDDKGPDTCCAFKRLYLYQFHGPDTCHVTKKPLTTLIRSLPLRNHIFLIR